MLNAPDQANSAAPITAADADALFQHLIPFKSLAVGVSGGSDSVALLVLLDDWRRRQGWNGDLVALTVDHGLRPESAGEAAYVSEICQKAQIPHDTLVWPGPKPTSNIQSEARDARMQLMADRMRGLGMVTLVLGHHQDDQVETFYDRLTRGSGVYGLGAMSSDHEHEVLGIRILRPLLSTQKVRLTATLVERGVDWCRDPSNFDEKYKRVRLRRIAGLLAEEGLDPDRVVKTAARMRRASDALMIWLDRIWAESVEEHVAGPVRISHAAFAALPLEMRLKLLAQMVHRVTAQQVPARLSKLEVLEVALTNKSRVKLPLAGALVERRGDAVFAWKEAGRVPPETLVIPDRHAAVWDRRYRIVLPEGLNPALRRGWYLGPLISAPKAQGEIDWPGDWPKAAFACAPAIWHDGHLRHIPGLFHTAGFLPCDLRQIDRSWPVPLNPRM